MLATPHTSLLSINTVINLRVASEMKENSEWKVHSGSFFTYNKIWPFFQFFKKYLYSIFAEAFWLLTIMQKDVDRDIEKIVPKEKKVNENKTVKNSVSIDRKKMLKE